MISDTLRTARMRKHMSLRDVAEKIGVTAASISNYENGRRVPRQEVFDALCKLYGLDEINLKERKYAVEMLSAKLEKLSDRQLEVVELLVDELLYLQAK